MGFVESVEFIEFVEVVGRSSLQGNSWMVMCEELKANR